MITFNLLHKNMTHEHLGFIPMYFDDRLIGTFSAEELMNVGYRQTAGSAPCDYFVKNPKFKMRPDGALKWPGDPWQVPIADYQFGDETLRFYDSAMFSIQQADGSFRVWRLD